MIHMAHDSHHGRARLRIRITICARVKTVSLWPAGQTLHASGDDHAHWRNLSRAAPAESGGLMASLPSSRAASSATSTGTLLPHAGS